MKIINIKEVNDLNNYVIIVPSNMELYYKKIYIKDNYNICNIRNFILDNYDGNKALANNNINYIIMYNAVKLVSNNLIVYKDLCNTSFINDLIITYNDFNKYKLLSNDKIKDLTLIFNQYKKLLNDNNLINENELIKYIIENKNFKDNYLFFNLSLPDYKYLDLFKKMNKEGNLLINIENYNNEYIVKYINEIDSSIKLKVNNNSLNNRKAISCSLNDISDEVMFVNNDISKKIIEGSRYSDFLIICNNEIYEPYINLHLNYPHTKNIHEGILTSRFIRIFKNILNGDFSCAKFIEMLKLGIYDVDKKIVDKIDNYVYSWDLEDKSFYLPFRFNPNGNKNNFINNDELDLEKLNEAKDNIINPIKYLLENIVGENNKTNLLRILFTYFKEEGLSEKLFKLDEKGYLTLVSILDDLNDYLDNTCSLVEIINLVDMLFKESNNIMNNQDEIKVTSLENALYEDKKYIYYLGCTSEELPKEFNLTSLITTYDIDKKNLIDKIQDGKNKWYYLFSKLMLNNNVCISYPKLGSDLKLKNISPYIKNINIKNVKSNKDYDVNMALNNYSLNLSEDKIVMADIDDFKLINDSKKHILNNKISNNNAINLYKTNLKVSPSSIETYAKCPFYHFCQYGLKLKVKEKYKFDSREIGTFVHYILQKVLCNDSENINLNNIQKYVEKYSADYLKENGKIVNNTVNYIISSLSKNAVLVLKNIIKEQDVSKFKPKYFEFKLDDNNIIKPVRIPLNNGEIFVNGIVDRIDIYEDNQNYYYRVVDYKTGDKKLKLNEVLDGLNLQMLLYLLAVKESENSMANKNVIPSGVLYYPALIKEELSSRKLSIIDKEKTISDRLKMNGIINKDALSVYGNENLGDYINVMTKEKISEEKIFDLDNLRLLFNKIKEIIKNIGNEILNGNVEVLPLDGDTSACDYCKFKSICKYDSSSDKRRTVKNYKNKEVFNMLRGDDNA